MEIPGHWVGMMGLKPFKYDNTHVPVAQVALAKERALFIFKINQTSKSSDLIENS